MPREPLHPDYVATLEMLLDRLISDDPGLYAFGDQGLTTGNMTDPRMMDRLRQVLGQAKRGELTRGTATSVYKDVVRSPRFSERRAAEHGRSDAERGGLYLRERGGRPDVRAKGQMFSAGLAENLRHQSKTAQELARRKEIMRRMLKLLKGGGALGLGLAALTSIMGQMSGSANSNRA